MYMMGFDITISTKEFKPHACMHHVVIIVMLALCYFIMSHATLILYYHTPMLTLQTFLMSRALWLPHVRYQGGWSVMHSALD